MIKRNSSINYKRKRLPSVLRGVCLTSDISNSSFSHVFPTISRSSSIFPILSPERLLSHPAKQRSRQTASIVVNILANF
jgi:hypothetical protein